MPAPPGALEAPRLSRPSVEAPLLELALLSWTRPIQCVARVSRVAEARVAEAWDLRDASNLCDQPLSDISPLS